MRVVLSNNPLAPSFDPVSGGQEYGEAPEVVAHRLQFALADAATVWLILLRLSAPAKGL